MATGNAKPIVWVMEYGVVSINFKENISEDLKNLAEEEQIKYEELSGVSCNYTPFYIVAKEQETILGITSGYTCYSEVYIDDIVVLGEHRKNGVGKAMLQTVEEHFANGLFNNINLVTNGFQAPLFYEKCGFTLEFIRHNKKSPTLDKYFYVKYFADII